MKRIIIGVGAGLICSIAVIAGVEMLAHKISPMPQLKPSDNAAFMNMPIKAFLWILAAYAIGAFVGGLMSSLIEKTGKYLPSLIVAGVLMLAGFANFATIPHPIWFMVTSSLCYPFFAVLGALAAKRFLQR